jgi:HEAT repeat protein
MKQAMKQLTCSAIIAATVLAMWSQPICADDAKLAQAAKDAGAWTFGGDAAPINYIAEEVVKAAKDPATRKSVEKHVIAGLAGAKTPASKDFFCRQLVIIGSDASVPQLAKLLGDKDSSHMARYALARLPGDAADIALIDALGKVSDDLKIGMVYSLGRRRCKAAVPSAIKLIDSKNETLAIAAITALGRIGSPRAVSAISKTRKSGSDKLKLAATDAYLTCAKRSSPSDAAGIYTELLSPSEPVMCRIAALNGLVMSTGGPKATALIIATMADKDPKIRQVAIASLRNVKDAGATKAIANELTKQDEQTRAVLINVLSGRGDKSALPIVIKAAGSSSAPVRNAAIVGLASIGDTSTVALLADIAVHAKEDADRTAASNSLVQMSAKGANAAIAAQIPRSKPPVRVELVRVLALRQASDAMPAVIKAARDEDPAVRVEAMKSLRVLAGPEHLPILVGFLTTVKDDKVRAEAQTTVLAATMKMKKGGNPVAALLAADRKATSPEVKISLLKTMGMIGHNAAIGTLTAGVKNSDPGVKDAAIRALIGWPSAAPIKTLAAVAGDKSASQTHRIIALRGYISMIDKQLELSDAEIMADYKKAITLATRLDDKRLVLSKLSSFRSRSALRLAESLAADNDLKRDADAAIKNIKMLLARPGRVTASHNSGAAKNAIDGDLGTRWDTGGAMRGGEWFKLELDADQTISGLVLDTKGSGADYPRQYEVYISRGSVGAGRLVAKGESSGPITKIKFDKPAKGGVLKIVQTGRAEGNHWSIHELTIIAR